jgi:hypothetical protein
MCTKKPHLGSCNVVLVHFQYNLLVIWNVQYMETHEYKNVKLERICHCEQVTHVYHCKYQENIMFAYLIMLLRILHNIYKMGHIVV